ncbi:DNA alkylation repair protein [Lachnoclostridium sp. An169]|uniref:DNA alkylation repair protein n=1 Tax=Lachnoclostridium sp. An169 TaxID=1965569 RepID=UPI000B390A0B|nr:DNA alkylation repair protein [Lachnoclostridium sp. An169]OUP85514.1 DNA alkylation repair protein [Lachnoclostridium sp. An169]
MRRITEEIREHLYGLAEEDYKSFNRNIVPGEERILGVRLPALRKLARETAKRFGTAYLDDAEKSLNAESLHEEITLYGLVISCLKMDREQRSIRLDRFVPLIRNWAICDTCVTSCKFMPEDPDYWFAYLEKYRDSDKEYDLRFMIVAMMSHFIDEEHIDRILDYCNRIRHDGYYVKMGVAWAVSVCYVKFPEKTGIFLENDRMDDFTHNKSIQKIRESYRVSREEKDALNLLKRKTR